MIRLKCSDCGRFVGRECWSYTEWGGYPDSEPPEPTILCQKCKSGLSGRKLARIMADVWIPLHRLEYTYASLGNEALGSDGLLGEEQGLVSLLLGR